VRVFTAHWKETAVLWSVGIEAEGDRVLTREDVVELADAVAGSNGIATGIGTTRYGAQLVVEADSRDDAIEAATETFLAAVRTAGLPAAPIVRTEAISELDEDGDHDGPGESP
jgi:hypothetical protein